MKYIILIRMPNFNNLVAIERSEFEVNSEEPIIAEFQSREEAEELMRNHSLRVFAWEIVEVEI